VDKRIHHGLLALCLATSTGFGLGLSTIASADDTINLDKLDLISEPGETVINLYTGTIVPYKAIYESDSKLVVEFDHVTAPKTIGTNLSQAANVSHIIFQPVNSHKIRMIIKGENLGHTAIHFKENPKNQSLIEALASQKRQTLSTTKALIETHINPKTVKPKPQTAPTAPKQAVKTVSAHPPEPAAADVKPKSVVGTTPPEPVDHEPITETVNTLSAAEAHEAAGSNTPSSGKAFFAASKDFASNFADDTTAIAEDDENVLPEDQSELDHDNSADFKLFNPETTNEGPGLEQVQPVVLENQPAPNPLLALTNGDWQNIFPPIDEALVKPLIGVVVILLGLGLFIRHKLGSLINNGRQTAESASGQLRRQAARLSFTALAQAYQQGEPQRPQTTAPQKPLQKPLFDPNNHPKKANKWASKPQPKKTDAQPVGLSALLENALPSAPPQPQPAKRQAPAVTPAKTELSQLFSKRQVVNQYQQQAKPVTEPTKSANNTPVKKPAAQKQPATLNPVQVARQKVQQKTSEIRAQRQQNPQQTVSAKATGNANEPIPGNPQVLDFLKNVAEYMERDGNTQRARSIQKNLRPYQ